jgi:hypothetical protein
MTASANIVLTCRRLNEKAEASRYMMLDDELAR